MSLARALLEELEPDDLADLARRLQPFLDSGLDRWMGVKAAAEYAGCSVPSLRYAIQTGAVEYQQHMEGGKVFLRRSAIDRWRRS